MKLRDKNDKYCLLTEINRLDLLDVDELPDDVFEFFIKTRRQRVNRLKDFRRSQRTKSSWRKSRYSYMTGIKAFHRSIKGKRFHRSMARFLALRYFPLKRPARESLEHVKDLALKASSSLRTHLYIEEGYYFSLDSQVDLELLAEYILPILQGIEAKLYEDICYELEPDELECLLRLTEEDELLKALSEISNIPIMEIKNLWYESRTIEDVGSSKYCSSRFFLIIENLRLMNNSISTSL